jgi:glucose/arabinose dehydrogenase
VRRVSSRRLLLVVGVALAAVAAPTTAQGLGSGGSAAGFKLVPVVSGLNGPVYVTQPPGDPRLFVVEQGGLIRIVQDGKLLPAPFADLTKQVTAGGEQGLLGLAFDPQFAKNGRLFVYYTGRNAHEQVWELRAKSGSNTVSGFRRLLLDMSDPYSNHNGGDLQFGPDGYLYIGTGDGGSGGDPQNRSQNPNSPLGKLLRIDVDKHPSGRPYAIPPGNPYAKSGKGLKLLYAWGLRNPWRYSFDRSTGDLWIGDVGQDHWEEVDHVAKGKGLAANFGWSVYEGRHSFKPSESLTGGGHSVNPVAEYSHSEGCSITGGYVYRGPSIPGLSGHYVYTDYCSARMWTIRPGSTTPTEVTSVAQAVDLKSPSSFGEGDDGTLYLVSQAGVLYRFAAA